MYVVNDIFFYFVYGIFSIVGSDGIFYFWDKDVKYRLKGYFNVGGSIVVMMFNKIGSIFVYVISYDWVKGY